MRVGERDAAPGAGARDGPVLPLLVRMALLAGRGLPEPVRDSVEDDVVSMAGCRHQSGRSIRSSELAVAAALVSLTELGSNRNAGHIPSLFPIGGLLAAAGALLIATTTALFPSDQLSHPLTFAGISLTFLVIAAVFLLSRKVPLVVTTAGSVSVAAVMVVQALLGSRSIPAEFLLDGACAIAALTIPLSWLPLIPHRPVAWSRLPDLVRASRMLTIGWWGQVATSLVLSAGGFLTVILKLPRDPTMARAGASVPILAVTMVIGVLLQSIGALVLSTSVAGVVRQRVRA